MQRKIQLPSEVITKYSPQLLLIVKTEQATTNILVGKTLGSGYLRSQFGQLSES